MYFVYDDFDNKYVMDYKEIKNLLIDSISEDIIDNHTDRDIVINGIKKLEELAQGKDNYISITKGLESCGWYVVELGYIERILESLQDLNEDLEYHDAFDKVLEYFRKGEIK